MTEGVPTVTEREQAAGTDGTESRVAPGQRQHGTAVPGRSPSRSVTAESCTGYPDCTAVRHTHGCYADEGNCDHPDEHKESDGGASGRERPVGSETEGDGTTPASPPPGTASAQQLADRVRDALNDLYHYTARRLAPGRSQMHEEGIKALAALVARVEQAERERDEAREDAIDARASVEAARAMRDRHEERYEKHKARADRYEKALREQAEPIMDERFRDRLLRHGLSNDEVAALVDAIYQRQQKALNALAGEDA